MITEYLNHEKFNEIRKTKGQSFFDMINVLNTHGQTCLAKINSYNPVLSNHEEVALAAHELKFSAIELGADSIADLMHDIEIAATVTDENTLLKLSALAPMMWDALIIEIKEKIKS